MNLYLGTLNHILSVYVGPVEPANAIDPAKVCIQIVCEEHSGIPGDKITFRIHAEDLGAFKAAFHSRDYERLEAAAQAYFDWNESEYQRHPELSEALKKILEGRETTNGEVSKAQS